MRYLHPGESFRVHVKLDTVRSPDIPKSFDYRTYLARQDIYKIGYIQKEDLKKVGKRHLLILRIGLIKSEIGASTDVRDCWERMSWLISLPD
jgi:hypothetical protein